MSPRLAPCRLYVTADRARVVFDGDTDAAFLLCAEGSPIPEGFDVPTEKVASAHTPKREVSARAKKS